MPKPITNKDIVRHYNQVPDDGPPRLELLRDAAAVIAGVPDSRFNLNAIYSGVGEHDPSAHNCGTIACAMGWLGLHPGFQEIGLKPHPMGGLRWRGRGAGYITAASELFNITPAQAEKLFGVVRMYEVHADWRSPTGEVGVQHKQIFMRRISVLVDSLREELRTGKPLTQQLGARTQP